MTTLNKLVIYSSMVFFFSCINGMKDNSADGLESSSKSSIFSSNIQLCELQHPLSRQIEDFEDSSSADGNSVFTENSSLSPFSQYNAQRNNHYNEGMLRSNSVDNFKDIDNNNGFYDSDVIVRSSENLSIQYWKSDQTFNKKGIMACASYSNFFSDFDRRAIARDKTPRSLVNTKRFEKNMRSNNSLLVYSEDESIYRPISKNTKVIVSIDGGGVRGIVPLTFLLAVQDAIFEKYGINLVDFVDAFIGTSVGALVATSAVIQKMKYVSDNFCEIDKKIFTRNNWSKFTLGLYGAWYSSKGKEEIFGDILNDVNVSSLSSRLLIPAYSNNTNEPIMFDSASQKPIVSLYDILMGTSAASTYFEPHVCKAVNGKTLQLIDPGMNKNSPALLSYEMIRSEYPYDRIVLLSIGTGADSKVKSISEYPNLLPSFACAFPTIVMDSAVRWDEWTMKYIEKIDKDLSYNRFQITLDKCFTDSVDSMYIETLKNATLATIHSQINPEFGRFQALIETLSNVIEERNS